MIEFNIDKYMDSYGDWLDSQYDNLLAKVLAGAEAKYCEQTNEPFTKEHSVISTIVFNQRYVAALIKALK